MPTIRGGRYTARQRRHLPVDLGTQTGSEFDVNQVAWQPGETGDDFMTETNWSGDE